MARDFDGTDDNINFGSDSSIDDLNPKTILFWMRRDHNAQRDHILAKDTTNAAWGITSSASANNRMTLGQQFDTTNGSWSSTNGIGNGSQSHFGISYDKGSVSNDPIFYIDAVAETTIEIGTPVGTASSDAANSLKMGESGAGTQDFDGAIGWLVVYDSILDAAAINRAKYWGRPHGGMKVYYPFTTDKLKNEGLATADVTFGPSGTTVQPMSVPVVRPCTATMGLGVGW